MRPALTLILLLGGAAAQAAELYTGLTVIGQHADGEGELTASADLLLETADGWTLYVEGSTAPSAGGIAARYPQANADAGTALDADGNGRFQISELRRQWSLDAGTVLAAGLMDTAAFIDRSHVTNDETRQFLGASFVNNPTIAFPDYTLGVAVDRPLPDHDGSGYALVLASSDGLADDPARSYASLLRAERGEGLFAAAALRHRRGDWTLRGGLWANSRRSARLDAPGREGRSARGLFGTISRDTPLGQLDLRLGWADPRQAPITGFASVGLVGGPPRSRLGLALAAARPSQHLGPERQAMRHAELFLRLGLFDERLQLSPSLQYIDNAEGRSGPSVWIAGLRLQINAEHRLVRLR